MEHKIEIVLYRKEGEYFDVQLAVDGVLAPSMEVHASARECYEQNERGEREWLDYLTRSSVSLIDVYGDARHPRPIEMFDSSLAGVA